MNIKNDRLHALLVTILLFMGNQMAMAETIEINFGGICYRLSDEDMTAMVIKEIRNVEEDIWEETRVEGDVVLPEYINRDGKTYVLTSIGAWAFENCSLTSIEISSNVTSIGECAFRNCSNLTSIKIPFSVTSIGEYAFLWCNNLVSVNIPNGVTSIEDGVFEDCCSLTSIEIPFGVTSIGNNAFSGCKNLTSIDMPSSVTSIGNSAFCDCESLTFIDIPSSVTSIGNSAFLGCSLTSVFIPSSVTSIGDNPFVCGGYLKSIVVEEGNSVYDSRNDCNAIIETATNKLVTGCCTSTIPYGVKTIGVAAFLLVGATSEDTPSSTISIDIPSSVTTIESSAFFLCNLASITIPSSVTQIGTGAFSFCDITSIIIPSGITRIEEDTFLGCTHLASITIPSSVTYIGNNAFGNCQSLKDVYCYGPEMIKDYCEDSFWGISDDATLHVNASLVDAYKSAEYWPEWFCNIIALEDETDIDGININTQDTYRIYTIDGKVLPSMQNGINILRSKTGKSVKVVK